MSFDALHSLASVGPDLDLAVLATGVAPAFFVEADASEECCSVRASHHTGLLQPLGDISWVPEDHLLGCHTGEPQVVGPLRPGHVEDAVRRAVCREQILLSLNVVDADAMVVVEVRGGDIAATG